LSAGTWAASWDSSLPYRRRPRCAFCSSTLTSASTPEPARGPTLGLLSDVHSNLEALEAALERMPKVDRILVLGDIVGYGPYRNASPRKPYIWESILDELQAREILMRLGDRFCFFGHTHLPRIFATEGEQVPQADDWIPLPPAALVSPGSVGQPRDGNPDAGYAVVDLEDGAVRFGRVPYDLVTTQAKIRQAGLPEVEAVRLALGQ